MESLEDSIDEITKISTDVKKHQCDGSLLLVDLAGSTAYKTRHVEAIWLPRLRKFYEAVQQGLNPLKPTKYLGDGIFVFVQETELSSLSLLWKAQEILLKINKLNESDIFRDDHKIRVRIILNSGSVYKFFGSDPQGTAVDKLFRMEKFVPDGFIGMTDEFVQNAGVSDIARVGRFLLKGMGKGRHTLYLYRDTGGSVPQQVAKITAQSHAAELWWLSGTTDQCVYLVGGYIPPEEAPSASVQMGDKNALLEAFYNLALAGDIKKISPFDSLEFRDEAHTENIVCIGGPCFNNVTQQLMEAASLPFRFEAVEDDENDETPLIDQSTGERFEKSYDKQKRLTQDWGLFARFKNPHNSDALVIIACGIESPAVDGIVRVFSPRRNPQFSDLFKHIVTMNGDGEDDHNLPEFCCIMPFKVEDNGKAVIPSLIEQKNRVILL